MRNIYPNSSDNKEFFPEHNEYVKKSSSENIYIMNNKTFQSYFDEGREMLSTLRVFIINI